MPLRSGNAAQELVIREATADDVPAILSIYREAGLDRDAAFTANEAAAQLEAFRAYPSYRVFVALLDRGVAGTYALLIMDNLAKRGRRSAVVEDVAVAPECQGNGVGRAMMLHAMEQCRQAGCYKLMLSSNLRRTEAHDFYQALGFEKHGYSFIVPIE
jgi:ribosomal protein S18 acetylase RimI-like enzyme